MRKRRGMTYGCVRGLLNCSAGGGWQSKRGQSGRSASGVKRDRSVAASQSYAKQNCQWHAVSPLSCPKAEQHNCQHSTAHKADPQSESGIANGMRNKTQRSVSPAEWRGASCLPGVNAKSTRRRGGITRERYVSLALSYLIECLLKCLLKYLLKCLLKLDRCPLLRFHNYEYSWTHSGCYPRCQESDCCKVVVEGRPSTTPSKPCVRLSPHMAFPLSVAIYALGQRPLLLHSLFISH